MTVDELAPYLGRRCNLRLRCRGCTGAHVLVGTPRPGKYVGDFVLRGYTFHVEDVEQVWHQNGPPRRRLNRARTFIARAGLLRFGGAPGSMHR